MTWKHSFCVVNTPQKAPLSSILQDSTPLWRVNLQWKGRDHLPPSSTLDAAAAIKQRTRARRARYAQVWLLNQPRRDQINRRWLPNMHSCVEVKKGASSQKGKLIKFVGVCWWDKPGGLFATETGAQCNSSSSLWLQGSRVGGLETSCQSCCLQISDCKAWTEACNLWSVCVHVPTVISTPQCGRGHNSFPFEGRPTDLLSNSQSLWPRPYFWEIC